jgi:hypothetical protein
VLAALIRRLRAISTDRWYEDASSSANTALRACATFGVRQQVDAAFAMIGAVLSPYHGTRPTGPRAVRIVGAARLAVLGDAQRWRGESSRRERVVMAAAASNASH